MGIRVLAVDDHPVVLNGIRAVIAKEHDMAVVAEASDGVAAAELYREHAPDVVLMDVHMPRLDGVGAIRAIVRMDPAARVVALSGSARDAEICRVLEAGACGYLVKEMLLADVVAAIRAAAAGKRVIPPDVAARLAEFMARVDLTAREGRCSVWRPEASTTGPSDGPSGGRRRP